jgi:2Fe-2S ferredoxin
VTGSPSGAGSVEVRPSGLRFDVGDGETVFAAAARAGLKWPTVCDGAEHCSPVGPLEQEVFDTVLHQPLRDRRLVCQLRVTGPVTVLRRGVRPLDPVT